MENVIRRTVVLVAVLFFAGTTGRAEPGQVNGIPDADRNMNREQAVLQRGPNVVASGPAPSTPAAKEKRVIAKIDSAGVQRVEITGGNFYFDPNDIVVKVNVPVELKVKKEGGFVSHDIIVKAPDAGINFNTSLSTDWKTIRFTPTKVGRYEMFCDERFLWFKSHKDRGMDGWIEVVP